MKKLLLIWKTFRLRRFLRNSELSVQEINKIHLPLLKTEPPLNTVFLPHRLTLPLKCPKLTLNQYQFRHPVHWRLDLCHRLNFPHIKWHQHTVNIMKLVHTTHLHTMRTIQLDTVYLQHPLFLKIIKDLDKFQYNQMEFQVQILTAINLRFQRLKNSLRGQEICFHNDSKMIFIYFIPSFIINWILIT